MRVTLREKDVIAIAEALQYARGGNYDDSYLRAFRELRERFDRLAFHTRVETARRRQLRRAVRVVRTIPKGDLTR